MKDDINRNVAIYILALGIAVDECDIVAEGTEKPDRFDYRTSGSISNRVFTSMRTRTTEFMSIVLYTFRMIFRDWSSAVLLGTGKVLKLGG